MTSKNVLKVKEYYADNCNDHFSVDGYSYFLNNFDRDFIADYSLINYDFTEYGNGLNVSGWVYFIIDFYEVLPFSAWYKENAGALAGLDLMTICKKWFTDFCNKVSGLENVTRLENGNYLSRYTPFLNFD